MVLDAAANVGRVDESGPRGVQLDHEGVVKSGGRGLKSARRSNTGSGSVAGNVGIPRRVDGDAQAAHYIQVRRINQGRKARRGGVDLRHEARAGRSPESAQRYRKGARGSETGHVGIAGAIQGNGGSFIAGTVR